MIEIEKPMIECRQLSPDNRYAQIVRTELIHFAIPG